VSTDRHDERPDQIAALLEVLDLRPAGRAHADIRPVRSASTAESGTVGGTAAGAGPDEEAPEAADVFAETISVFVGQSQKTPYGRVFGGQVLAQGVIACGRTVTTEAGAPIRAPHSLHAYFMRPGDDTRPIHFAVETMRDGRSFSTRRVHAIQNGKPILSMIASFQEPAGGLDHQDPMPDVPGPEGLRSLTDVFAGIDHPGARHLAEGRAIEQRHVEGNLYLAPGAEEVARQHIWLRAIGELPDDPLIHSAVLAYASDYSLLEPVLRRHGLVWTDRRLRPASLDHSMWFHRPVRADDWVLYASRSPSAQGGRGLGIGRMFAADGTLVATVAQEGMVRVRED
jgi:acyl-CoA thioesterase-2